MTLLMAVPSPTAFHQPRAERCTGGETTGAKSSPISAGGCRAAQERDTEQPNVWVTDRATGQGAGEVGVVAGLPAGDVVLVVCVLVGEVVVGLVFVVAALVVVVVVDVAGAVFVTVVAETVAVTVVGGLVFFVTFAEPPKNVVGWPLPVTECPARRSGTTAGRQRGRKV